MSTRELSYSDFRDKAEKFNAAAQQFSFCKAIDGGCCMRNVSILREDKEIIKEAIRKGNIPRETIRRAQRRARNPQEKRCPFLGEEGECTIYPYRPVICINHGNGGFPKNESKGREILGGSSEDITVGDLGPFSCGNCIPHVDQGVTLPSEVVRKAIFIKYELNRRPNTALNSFITQELPHY